MLAGGIAEKEYADKIKSLIGDDPNILCTGFVTGDEMSALYANCALYVLPSHTEGLGAVAFGGAQLRRKLLGQRYYRKHIGLKGLRRHIQSTRHR